MKYRRRTAGYTWTDYKTNAQIAKELKITPILDKLLEYKRSWIQHVNRMPRNRLPWVMKHYCPTARRNHGRPLKRLLDTRPERVSKWPNSMKDMMMMMMMMYPAQAIFLSVACPALQYFSTLAHKRHDFLKQLPNTKCMF